MVRAYRVLPSPSNANLDPDEYDDYVKEIGELDKNRIAKIVNLLSKLGFPTHLRGYWYLLWLLDQVLIGNMRLDFATKFLYPNAANHFGTTSFAMERNLRYLIAWTWENGDASVWSTFLGHRTTKPPSTITFIRICTNQFKYELFGALPMDLIA